MGNSYVGLTGRYESVFHTIETPYSADFLQRLSGNEIKIFKKFLFSSILWVIIVCTFSHPNLLTGLPEVFLLHPSVATILVGATLFPIRWLPITLGVYTVSFFTGMGINSLFGPPQPFGWELIGFALVFNLAVGLICGLTSFAIFHLFRQKGFMAPAATWASGMLVVTYAIVGCVSVRLFGQFAQTLLAHPMPSLGEFASFQRVFRIGVTSAAVYLIFIDMPGKRHFREAVLFLPLFLGKAILTNEGFFLGELLDPVMIGAALLLTRPIHLSMTATVVGFCVYSVITGQYINQNPIDSIDAMRVELISSASLAIMLMISVARVSMQSYNRRQMETLARTKRAQDSARLGFFVVDVKKGSAQIDPIAQDILGAPKVFDTAEFARRLHPDDRVIYHSKAINTLETESFALRFNRLGPWTSDVSISIINVFLWHEKLWDHRVICYGAIVDVTSEHHQEEHLKKVLSELSDRQDRQTQLFSIVSHELRTPASLITMILEEMDNNGKWEELGPQLHSVTEHLISVLSDMRQTVRPEQNLPVHLEYIRPQAIAESIKNTFELLARGKNISIQLRMSDVASKELKTDRVRLIQALSNLVKNAILHSKCSVIVVSYREERSESGSTAYWRVWDNGVGLSQKIRSQLFEPFARDSSTKTRSDGSGLGLHIARSAIQIIGGNIISVERPNSGACFEITHPILREDCADITIDDKASIRENFEDLSSLHLLLVEDSEMIGSILEARLGRIFKKVEWVIDGQKGLDVVRNSPPDVVLTDLFMPGLGGDELTRQIRSEGYTAPVIGMTAAEFGDEIEKFRLSGADAVLTKPVRMDALKRIISDTIKK